VTEKGLLKAGLADMDHALKLLREVYRRVEISAELLGIPGIITGME